MPGHAFGGRELAPRRARGRIGATFPRPRDQRRRNRAGAGHGDGRRGNPNLKVLPQAAAEGKAVVFTVSRPIAAASHLSQGVLWVNVDGGVFSEVTGAGRWIGSHFCHARQVRFEKGDMRASVRLETHCNGVIGAGGTVRAILDDGLSSYCEDSHDWEPVATVTGSPGRATVAATDSETADWTGGAVAGLDREKRRRDCQVDGLDRELSDRRIHIPAIVVLRHRSNAQRSVNQVSSRTVPWGDGTLHEEEAHETGNASSLGSWCCSPVCRGGAGDGWRTLTPPQPPPASESTGHVEVNGVSIHYALYGSGNAEAGITVPFMIAAGVYEEGIDEGHTKRMAELIPGAQLLLIGNASHFAHWQQVEVMNSVILEFLAAE